jgi:hypothetical protein
MPPFEDILRYLNGAWRMMMGRADGLREFEISADGFWNSFFAIIVALPPLFVGWAAIASDLGQDPVIFGGRFSIFLRLAFIDLAAWVLPLAALATVARPAGIGNRFVHYVITSNWGSALIAWAMLPPSLVRLVAGDSELLTLVSLTFVLVTLVLSWRLTNVALAKGPGIATAVFGGMLAASLGLLFALQGLLGLGASV